MSDRFLILGAGGVGWALAEALVARGDEVTVATRSGSGPDHPLVRRVRADAADRDALRAAADGVTAILCAVHGSKYAAATWRAELPPIEQAVMDVAEELDIPVVFTESLYAFGAPTGPITENSPYLGDSGKSAVRKELLAARAAHPATTISVAASDFVGPRATAAHVSMLILPKVLANSTVWVLGATDQPHSFTYVPDLARTMIAAADRVKELAPEGDRVIFAPTAAPLTMAEMTAKVAAAAGVATPKVRPLPAWLVKSLGLVVPDMREMADVLHQWTAPYVLDTTAAEAELGFGPTPIDEAVAATVEWGKAEAAK